MDFVTEHILTLISTSGGVVPAFIDYLSVVVGVLTGALFACDRKLDIIGVTVLGLVTGYGGGMFRDFLLQSHGVYFMSHPYLLLVCIALCIVVFFFRQVFDRIDSVVFVGDALSVALFAVAGASKAFTCDAGYVMSIALGVLTAVGGGALRDVAVGEVPGIFKASNFYAVAALAGSFVYVTLVAYGAQDTLSAVLCVVCVVGLRCLSVHFDWKTGSDKLLHRSDERR